jgi:hypothetical protein
MTVASDGTVYVTNSLAPQILQLKPGGKTLEVWVENKQFQPPSGIGLDALSLKPGPVFGSTTLTKLVRSSRQRSVMSAASETARGSTSTLPAALAGATILTPLPRPERKQHSILARLGNVLYWFGCGLACGVLGLGGVMAYSVSPGDNPMGIFIFFVVAAVLVWLVGRACRYVLSGN